MPSPLRLMTFDRSNGRGGRTPGLAAAWWMGGHLYRALGRFDAWAGFDAWPDALEWLANTSASTGRPIGEIQYWGHGHPGMVLMGKEALEASSLAPRHAHSERLQAVRERLVPGGEALWWFRTCSTFAGAAGHAFARAWTRYFQCRAAGHTYLIGPWQSGLHELDCDEEPTWPQTEGGSVWSGPRAPSTITFLHGALPRRPRPPRTV